MISFGISYYLNDLAALTVRVVFHLNCFVIYITIVAIIFYLYLFSVLCTPGNQAPEARIVGALHVPQVQILTQILHIQGRRLPRYGGRWQTIVQNYFFYMCKKIIFFTFFLQSIHLYMIFHKNIYFIVIICCCGCGWRHDKSKGTKRFCIVSIVMIGKRTRNLSWRR